MKATRVITGMAGSTDANTDAVRSQRYERLKSVLQDCASVCIGYSGGVDSVFLAKVAVDTLGAERVLAVTGRSAAYPGVQRDIAIECSQRFGIPHLEIDTDELNDPNYAANPSNRCYYCKSELWTQLRRVADEHELQTVLDGSNADDAHDYRPGMQAARERAVRSPLLEAGLTKEDIRALSHELGLPTWDQPSAPCLSSRLPYGLAVTPQRLREVESAEEAVRALGFRDFRVRHHGNAARIELPRTELARALNNAASLASAVCGAGFNRVLLDVEGYRRGALNEVLVQLDTRKPANADDSGADGAGADDAGAVDTAGHQGEIAVLGIAPQSKQENVIEILPLLATRATAAKQQGYRYAAIDLAALAG